MPLRNVKLGKHVTIPHPELVNAYDCEIGDHSFVGPFVEIQSGVIIGNNTRIQSHAFICSKVTIGDHTFIGHSVMFTNDKFPVHTNPDDWQETHIGDYVVIGNNATILPCRIDDYALIGAGAVVTKDIPAKKIAYGNPAVVRGDRP